MQYREKSGIQTYTLPAIEDLEGYQVTINIVLNETSEFTTYEASIPQLVFNIDSPYAVVG